MAWRYQWSPETKIRPGDWVCPDHGPIEPDTTTAVPSCPVIDDGQRCLRSALHAEADRHGKVGYVQPPPDHCSGPGRHDLRPPRTATITRRPCRCATGPRGHAVWICSACGAESTWPPCANG